MVSTADKNVLQVQFTAAVTDAQKLPNYIVKLTPIWSTQGTTFGFRLYLDQTF